MKLDIEIQPRAILGMFAFTKVEQMDCLGPILTTD